MSLPPVVSRDEWLVARKALLAKEKAFTRERDALSAERRRLPMVEIDKEYVFDGPTGKVGLADLFEGRNQLIVVHFMFDPSWDDGCPSCTAGAGSISPCGMPRRIRSCTPLRAGQTEHGVDGVAGLLPFVDACGQRLPTLPTRRDNRCHLCKCRLR